MRPEVPALVDSKGLHFRRGFKLDVWEAGVLQQYHRLAKISSGLLEGMKARQLIPPGLVNQYLEEGEEAAKGVRELLLNQSQGGNYIGQ